MASTIGWPQLVVHMSGFAHLATIRPDRRPHVSKVAPAIDDEVMWIATRASSRKARNLAQHAHAALMFEPLAEVYVQADAELVTDLSTREQLWTSGRFPFPLAGFFGAFDHPDFVLIRLTPTSAVLMSQGDDGIQRHAWERARTG